LRNANILIGQEFHKHQRASLVQLCNIESLLLLLIRYNIPFFLELLLFTYSVVLDCKIITNPVAPVIAVFLAKYYLYVAVFLWSLPII
ncbi:hypothetical protein ACJX0J_018101, partial [Zea mays]